MTDSKKGKSEKVEDYFERLRSEDYKIEGSYQGITLKDISVLLKKIGRYTDDIRDVVFCLLNDKLPSPFSNASNNTISNGASVAHIGSYIGILQRGKKKLDREGRDYWIKPLREIGAIDEVTFNEGKFYEGHLKAKSPNSCYRLNKTFVEVLKKVNDENFDSVLADWMSNDKKSARLAVHLEVSLKNKESMNDSGHKSLINDSINIYAKHFLKGYIPVFIDAEDGERITPDEQKNLKKFKIVFGKLDDVWPDVILYNSQEDSLWFIEAVTSDGEVDDHKMKGLHKICKQSNKKFGGATTTYLTWEKFSSRQKKEQNLAIGSYVWIKEAPEKYLEVK